MIAGKNRANKTSRWPPGAIDPARMSEKERDPAWEARIKKAATRQPVPTWEIAR